METRDGISLTNDGRLEVAFLGVGSAFALRNFQTNFLITKGETHILVDAGQKIQLALDAVGIAATDIEVVLPTHSHADHIGGVETLALMNRFIARRYMDKPKIKMIITGEYQKILWEYSLRGGLENNEQLEDGCGLGLTNYFDILRPVQTIAAPRRIFRLDYGGIRLELFQTLHFPGQAEDLMECFVSYGLLVDEKVFVSSDTKFDPGLIDAYRDRAEILFHDVQFFTGGVHASLEELATLDEEVRSRMYLIHYADNYEEQDLSGFAGLARQGITYRF